MIREFSVIIEKDSDGYFVASIPNLQGCHTQAKSLDVLMERIQEAAELCLEFELELKKEENIISEFMGILKILVKV